MHGCLIIVKILISSTRSMVAWSFFTVRFLPHTGAKALFIHKHAAMPEVEKDDLPTEFLLPGFELDRVALISLSLLPNIASAPDTSLASCSGFRIQLLFFRLRFRVCGRVVDGGQTSTSSGGENDIRAL